MHDQYTMAWISKGDDVVSYEPSYQKENQQIITIKMQEVGIYYTTHSISVWRRQISPFAFLSSSSWDQMSVWGGFQKPLYHYDFNQLLEQDAVIETFDTEPWAQQLDL